MSMSHGINRYGSINLAITSTSAWLTSRKQICPFLLDDEIVNKFMEGLEGRKYIAASGSIHFLKNDLLCHIPQNEIQHLPITFQRSRVQFPGCQTELN